VTATGAQSDFREEYVVKKYLDKRWVATALVPDTPRNKIYCKPETWVIENVYSGKLFVPLDIGQASLPPRLTPRLTRLPLLMRSPKHEPNSDSIIIDFKECPQRVSDLINVDASHDAAEHNHLATTKASTEALECLTIEDSDDSGGLYEKKEDNLSVSEEYDLLADANDVALESSDRKREVFSRSTYLISPVAKEEDWECDSILLVCDIGIQTE
jgi:hypothetical protein